MRFRDDRWAAQSDVVVYLDDSKKDFKPEVKVYIFDFNERLERPADDLFAANSPFNPVYESNKQIRCYRFPLQKMEMDEIKKTVRGKFSLLAEFEESEPRIHGNA